MTRLLTGSALALPLFLAAAPALADSTDPEATVQVHRADGHGPAGTMDDHLHRRGEVMIGLTWMHEDHRGANLSGNAEISDAAIVAAGYTARTKAMTMDMAMLHVMWAPSDRITLMAMPSWTRMEMTMLGISSTVAAGHHALALGQTMTHATSGIGDTRVGALVALSRKPALSAHAGLFLSLPTGSVTRKDDDGNFVHYGMQPGSGTWDLQPSLTLRGSTPGMGWGAQASYLVRTGTANASGFKFGDRFTATAWLSKPLGQRVSLSGRLAYSAEGAITGHYNSGHNHAAPADRQANYGGKRLEAGIGANLLIGEHYQLGVEATVPLYQDLNGIQVRKRFATSVQVSRKF